MGDTLVRQGARVAPPTGAGTGTRSAPSNVSVGAASTTAQDTGVGSSHHQEQDYVTFECTEECYIRFGGSDVGAATSDDWPLHADQPVTWLINPDRRYFRAIRATADGTMKWYRSSG